MQIHRGERACDNVCDWVVHLQARKHQGLPEAKERHGAESPLEATEGTSIAHTWISEF